MSNNKQIYNTRNYEYQIGYNKTAIKLLLIKHSKNSEGGNNAKGKTGKSHRRHGKNHK